MELLIVSGLLEVPISENCCSQLVFQGFTYNTQDDNNVKRNNTAECIAFQKSKASLVVKKKILVMENGHVLKCFKY